MPKIEIEYEQCRRVAKHIQSLGGFPPDREDPMPLSFPQEVQENAWWATVAINHQTTPVAGTPLRGYVEGVLRNGWDYLLQRAIHQANRLPGMFTREWLLSVTAEDLREIFRDDIEGDTLYRPEGRVAILHDLGRFLLIHSYKSVQDVYEKAQGYLEREDGRGILKVLSGTVGYADPVKKKAFYFLAIMKNQGFWQYPDAHKLSSPVNYHEQRLHFRLGTVRIVDVELIRKIMNRENISFDEDIEIRFAVRGAIEFMASELGITPSSAHYGFWNYARNDCSRNAVHCKSCGNGCKLPERYRINGIQHCIFSAVCKSAYRSIEELPIEPRLDDTIWQ